MLWFLVNDQRDAQIFTVYLFLFIYLFIFTIVVVCNSASIQWSGGIRLSHLPHYFELKTPSNLRRAPTFIKEFTGKNFSQANTFNCP
jgi:hypothetical protein